MWARIEDGMVAEVTEIDPAGRFHASLIWVGCPSDVCPGMTYSANKFGPKPGPDLTSLAAIARADRDQKLREVYDVGIMQAKREERLGADVSARLAALDTYAIALLDVPQQPGFPTEIQWPDIPDA